MADTARAEQEPLVKKVEPVEHVEPFKATPVPPLSVLLNPFAWLLWVLDFLLWLVSVVLPVKGLLWCLRRKCGKDSVENPEEEEEDLEMARRRQAKHWEDGLLTSPFDDDPHATDKTVWDIFTSSAEEFEDEKFLGTREYFGDHTPEGSKLVLKIFGDTTWQTYGEAALRVKELGAGLRALGLVPLPSGTDLQRTQAPHTLLLFEETCADWITTLLASFSQSIAVATSYATLGIPSVVEAINETNATVCVCNRKNVAAVAAAAPPVLRYIIYTENYVAHAQRGTKITTGSRVQALSLEEVIQLGKQNLARFPPTPPKADCMALVMYTSGSTGKPKGVMLQHKNIVSAVAGLRDVLAPVVGAGNRTVQPVYLAYLPAAHILELCAEMTMVAGGAALGFADPRTISSKGAVRRLENGELNFSPGYPNPPGGIQEFRPTVMAAVPMIWSIMQKGVEEELAKKSCVVRFLFQVAFSANYFAKRMGRRCPLFDLLIFRTFKNLVGGNLTHAVSGGGPISDEVQTFIRTVFGLNLIQGYALTESCCAGAVQDLEDVDDLTVGPPIASVEIKLRSCDGKEDPKDREGKQYLNDDTEHLGVACLGRGEVCIRGPPVSLGYFKQPEKTAEVFQQDGWFRTGDVGVWDTYGRLKIVDRLKNLVKLLGGEYIALESMEKEYSTSPFVNSMNGGIVCIGDGSMRRPAALVQANLVELTKWAQSQGIQTDNPEELCRNPKVRKAVLENLQQCAKKGKLNPNEVIGSVRLIPGTGSPTQASWTSPWVPENGCRTASNKLERRNIANVCAALIEEMKPECA